MIEPYQCIMIRLWFIWCGRWCGEHYCFIAFGVWWCRRPVDVDVEYADINVWVLLSSRVGLADFVYIIIIVVMLIYLLSK